MIWSVSDIFNPCFNPSKPVYRKPIPHQGFNNMLRYCTPTCFEKMETGKFQNCVVSNLAKGVSTTNAKSPEKDISALERI